ncbi:hypothetical protein FRC00_001947, partial [Tulasnella sp. 408]
MYLGSTVLESTTPPIYTIPPEIVGQILRVLVEQSTNGRYRDLIHITHTSSPLRYVATTVCPTLWSVITIGDKRHTIKLAKACLRRSGSQKLDIRIAVGFHLHSKLRSVLDFLNMAAPRIRSLDLDIAISKEEYRICLNDALRSFEFPALELLVLDLWSRGREGVSPVQVPLPCHIPRFRALNLIQLIPQSGTESLRNLRILTIWARSFWAWPYRALYRLLEECQLLEDVHFDRSGSVCYEHLEPIDVWVPEPPMVLSKLHRIKFQEVERSFMAHFLTSIDTPNLDTVEFELQEESLASNPRLQWPNLPRSLTFPSVSTLRISRVRHLFPPRESPDLAISLLKLFPRVKKVELPFSGHDFLGMWENFWSAQRNGPHPDPSVFWLDLRQLRMGRPSGHSGTGCCAMLQSALTFVENRDTLGLPRLERVTAFVCKDAARGKAKDCASILLRLHKALSSPGALEVMQITSSDM